MKVQVAAPEGTVTESGGLAFGLLELIETLTPPVGAIPSRVTTPTEVCPPVTGVETERPNTPTGVMTNVAEAL